MFSNLKAGVPNVWVGSLQICLLLKRDYSVESQLVLIPVGQVVIIVIVAGFSVRTIGPEIKAS